MNPLVTYPVKKYLNKKELKRVANASKKIFDFKKKTFVFQKLSKKDCSFFNFFFIF